MVPLVQLNNYLVHLWKRSWSKMVAGRPLFWWKRHCLNKMILLETTQVWWHEFSVKFLCFIRKRLESFCCRYPILDIWKPPIPPSIFKLKCVIIECCQNAKLDCISRELALTSNQTNFDLFTEENEHPCFNNTKLTFW